jgi:arylsulfatase A-like enzyme
VLFADHNCYYSNLGYDIKQVKEFSNTSEIYNIPFAIYNKKLAKGKVDTFCTTFDIYPTICDLYGMVFNKSLVQGNSVFSTDINNSVFVSNISGIFDDKYFTRTLDDYTPQDNSMETATLLESFKQKVNNYFIKQQQIELYYATNYEKNIK